MQDAVILDRAGFSDDYLAVVASNHGARPDAGVLADLNVADYISSLTDETGGMNLWSFSIEAANHGDLRCC
jgi:hypothetical protein